MNATDVFEAWRATRPRPTLCRFSQGRRDLINKRMRAGFSAEDLIALIRYTNEAEQWWPRHMRGHNDRGTEYLDLTNLLVAKDGKLAKRVEEALTWFADGCPSDADPSKAWVRLTELWAELRGRGVPKGLDHREGIGRKLDVVLEQHGEEPLARVFRWVWSDPSEQARWLRQDYGKLSVVLGDRFTEFLDAASATGAAQGSQGPASMDGSVCWRRVLGWVGMGWHEIPNPHDRENPRPYDEDPATASAIAAGLQEVGGLPGLKRLSTADMGYRRKPFLEAFNAALVA